jgi:hypothetical protein
MRDDIGHRIALALNHLNEFGAVAYQHKHGTKTGAKMVHLAEALPITKLMTAVRKMKPIINGILPKPEA